MEITIGQSPPCTYRPYLQLDQDVPGEVQSLHLRSLNQVNCASLSLQPSQMQRFDGQIDVVKAGHAGISWESGLSEEVMLPCTRAQLLRIFTLKLLI